MKITLKDFEEQIDEVILDRGLEYLELGCVKEVTPLNAYDYEAIVEGSEDYYVDLTIKNGVVKQYFCDCPYDYGPVCKHVAAVLYYMQKNLFTIDITDGGIDEENIETKQKMPMEQVDEALEALSVSELNEFIRIHCEKDRGFRTRFLMQFAKDHTANTETNCAIDVENVFDTYINEYGGIDYYEIRDFNREISDKLEDAEHAIETGYVRDAFLIVSTIMKRLPSVFNYTDDSSGYLGYCLSYSFSLLSKIVVVPSLDESLRLEIFDHLILFYENKELDEWGWGEPLLSAAIQLIHTTEEKNRMLKILNEIKPTEEYWDWNYRMAQKLMLQLITVTEDSTAVYNYLINNITNPDFREQLITQAIKSKEYTKALTWANEGMVESDKEGENKRWERLQLNIYEQLKDKKNIIRLTSSFIIDSFELPRKEDYNLLKKNIPAESWNKHLEQMLAEIIKKKDGYSYEKIESLYIWEKSWAKYLVLLQNNANLQRVEQAEEYLSKLYPDQLVLLYRDSIFSFLEQNVGRSFYQQACEYIRRMRKLGGDEVVELLIEQLKKTYKNRKALLDELGYL